MSVKSIIGTVALIVTSWSLPTWALQAVTQIATSSSNAVYAQLESVGDQLATPDTVNQGMPVVMQAIDNISGMQWDSQSSKMLIQQDGVYFIMAVLQVGAKESSADIIKGGDIYFWFELNGAFIADSGSWIFASPTSRSKTITDQIVMPLKKGDVLRFMYSSSAPSMGLLATPAQKNQPGAGGISLTLFKIDSTTPATPAISASSAAQ